MKSNGEYRVLMIVFVLAGLVSGQALAEEPIRFSRNVPGDSKPILIDADEIISWKEDNNLVVVLKGKVLVQQGVVQARFDQAAGRIDLNEFQKSRVLHLDLVGDGNVALANGQVNQKGQRAVLDLNTRGEFKLSAHKGKVVREARPNDSMYRWLLTEKKTQTVGSSSPGGPSQSKELKKNDSPVKRTSFQDLPPDPKEATPVEQPRSGPGVPSRDQPSSPLPEPPPDLPPPDFSPPGPAPPGPTAAGVDVKPPPDLSAPGREGLRNPAPRNTTGPSIPPITASGPLPAPALRQFTILPRTQGTYQEKAVNLPNGRQAVVFSGGVIVNIRGMGGASSLDIEADRLVLWLKGRSDQMLGNLRSPDGSVGREFEFYLSGNVEIREQSGKDARILRAEEVYYDLSRNVAVAVGADLEFRQKGIPDPLHLKASELEQLAANQFKALQAEFYSSRLPSDPGLKLVMAEATLEEKKVPKTSIFGQRYVNRGTGALETEEQQMIVGKDLFLKIEDVPVFYSPFVQGDANDPLGPLRSVNVGYSRVFGFQAGLSLNMFDLFAITPRPGLKWNFDIDYLSRRGPALGTNFDYNVDGLFGLPGRYVGFVKAFGIDDHGSDILGGGRGEFDHHPEQRGSVQWQQTIRELPDGFSVRTGLGLFSDKNLYEQYQKNAFDTDVNQETYAYIEQQKDNWAWTFLAEQRIRNWVTETNRLPQVDGYLVGQSFFDLITYNGHASAGYDQLQLAHTLPPPYLPTDVQTNTGRFDLMQELSLPFYAGPVKVVPYGVLDLTEYTSDINGDSRGRAYGGGGVRASMPLTRLYSDVESRLFNLNGINHKIVLSGNFYYVESSEPFTQFAQLDRLDDDATDQARRDFHAVLPLFNPGHGLFLQNSPLFDPQRYAIRRLVDTNVDTLDSIEVFQADIRQRWQTKRGYPGQQHTVDFLTLDLSASFFPRADRDNFGETVGFLEYDLTWNVGDRTAIVSSGWADPNDGGARVFTIGAFLNRPDRTNVFLGYRQIDPVGSQAITGAISYVFSPKYAMTAATVYDFGTQQALSNSLVLTRMGSDLQVSMILSYNALQNNFGFSLEIFPNAVSNTRKMIAGAPTLGTGLVGR